MQGYTPIQWLQKVVKNGVDYWGTEEYDTGEEELRQMYERFSYTQKQLIHKLLLEQFELKDGIYILSYLVSVLRIEEFWQDVADSIDRGQFDGFTGCMLELQLEASGKILYRQMRSIHRKNVVRLADEMGEKFSYLPTAKRNRKRIAIITDYMLNKLNAPTAIVLETIYVLQNKLGYEVLLLTCTSNRVLDPCLWTEFYYCYGGKRGDRIIDYKDEQICVGEYPMLECGIEEYREMLFRIYNWNPLFVWNIGTSCPIADLPCAFTTVVSEALTIRPPVSEANIFLRLAPESIEREEEYGRALEVHQKQIFLEKKVPPVSEAPKEVWTRQKLGLPESGFLIAIVGNRLAVEIDEVFAHVMLRILQINEKIHFVIIGDVELVLDSLQDEYQRRIHWLGFCEDLPGVYQTLDLYLNPKRAGGGWSSAIALRAGLPVVTLPDCDVAYNASPKFEVLDYEEMITVVNRYATDTAFYKVQSEDASRLVKGNDADKFLAYVQEAVAKIEEAMTD